jgi:hypothetical protein
MGLSSEQASHPLLPALVGCANLVLLVKAVFSQKEFLEADLGLGAGAAAEAAEAAALLSE